MKHRKARSAAALSVFNAVTQSIFQTLELSAHLMNALILKFRCTWAKHIKVRKLFCRVWDLSNFIQTILYVHTFFQGRAHTRSGQRLTSSNSFAEQSQLSHPESKHLSNLSFFKCTQSPNYSQGNYKTASHTPQTCMYASYERGSESSYLLRPCDSGGLAILLMHSSVRINNSCEVWTRWRIKPVTCSYSMIFLIIRSLCWTASNFSVDPTGSPGVADESQSLRALWGLECKCELWRGVSIFKLVGSFWRLSINPSTSASFLSGVVDL